MRWEKKKFIAEVEEQNKQFRCSAILSTIMRYLTAEQAKNPRGWYIGITTVLILVTVMTMFKSVIDASPIIFVKLG